MKRTALALALMAAAAMAFAQDPGYGPRGGGGYGDGPCAAAGGPMMGGGGPMMGRGMMGDGFGPGAGRGMRGGGGGAFAIADLTQEQRDKMAAIREQHRRDDWTTVGQLRTEQFKLRGLFAADPVDPDAVVAQQKRVDELRGVIVKSRVVQHNEMRAVLTPEQRKQARGFGPRWMREQE